jgi:hypothetical protein
LSNQLLLRQSRPALLIIVPLLHQQEGHSKRGALQQQHLEDLWIREI